MTSAPNTRPDDVCVQPKKRRTNKIDISILSELLELNPSTGVLIWKTRSDNWFSSPKNASAWNSQHSGKIAFTTLGSRGYLRGKIFGEAFSAHRVCFAIHHLFWPDIIDHINGVREDNRISNLRSVNAQENNRNSRINRRNTSGVPGVSLKKREMRWCAEIKISGKSVHLGYFASKADAIAVRKAAEVKYGFHKNHGRSS